MQFYSDELKKLFATEEECKQAEEEAIKAKAKAKEEKEKLLAERKARADEVEEAKKAMIAAQKKYEEVLNQFLRDYHTYHYSTSSIDELPNFFRGFFFDF